ncbi:MAG: hypothetical protein AMXMBFR7_01130 [Planctomycetota bacterium]
MLNRSMTAVCVLAALFGMGQAWALGGAVGSGAQGSGGSRANFKPGSDKTFSWKRLTFTDARKLEKPICLYIYDSTMKQRNNTAMQIETDLLPNPVVKDALKDFTMVMTTTTSPGWPELFTQLADKGAMIAVMTCDGKTFVNYFNKDRKADPQVFSMAAQQAVAQNGRAVGIAKADAEKDKAAADAAAKQEQVAQGPEEPKPPKLIPGLGGPNEKKTEEARKPPEKKTGVVEEEE